MESKPICRGGVMNLYKIGMAPLHIIIRKVMAKAGKSLKAWQIEALIRKETGKRYSESTVTARLREMRDVKCNLSNNTYGLAL
jgi:repressor of nif and glnA expression